jgi:hypothetical protein
LPLGDALFEERPLFSPILQRFPRALDVTQRLRLLPSGRTVESVMEQLRAEAETDHRRHKQLAAIRYYLQMAISECESAWERDAAHGVTNYRSLLDLIENKRKPDDTVCIVTFNYDTMLDRALEAVDIQIRKIDDYVASKNYKVIKVHGSVSWGREVEPPMHDVANYVDERLIEALIDGAASLKVTDRFHLANQRPVSRLDMNRPMIPAIAIPVQTKGAFECPAEHLAALDECLPKVDRLLVIGWRATDMHFLKLLRERTRDAIRGMVVAGSEKEAHKVIRNLHGGLNRPGELVAAVGGFSQFMVLEVDAFLS